MYFRLEANTVPSLLFLPVMAPPTLCCSKFHRGFLLFKAVSSIWDRFLHLHHYALVTWLKFLPGAHFMWWFSYICHKWSLPSHTLPSNLLTADRNWKEKEKCLALLLLGTKTPMILYWLVWWFYSDVFLPICSLHPCFSLTL